MAGLTPRFLVVSLGNKEPYYQSLHSAGHFALLSLQRTLGGATSSSSQSAFSRDKKDRALRSDGPIYTLKQSPTYMNVSGPWVNKAWKQHLIEHNLQPHELSVVLVSDDLEESFGTVRIRKWTASHRGHNGLKSINRSITPSHFPGVSARFHRISVGIGRPADRDQKTVSDFVLGKMSSHQLGVIESDVGPRVLECLETLRAAWEAEIAKGASNP